MSAIGLLILCWMYYVGYWFIDIMLDGLDIMWVISLLILHKICDDISCKQKELSPHKL